MTANVVQLFGPKRKLSLPQWALLIRLHERGVRGYRETRHEHVTLRALRRRKLAHWRSDGAWIITPAGIERAEAGP